MDWREFVASIVDSLAWPAGIAVIVLLLRRQIGALLEGRVKSLQAGPVALEFWEEQVAEVGVAIASGETPPSPELDPEIQRIAELADQTPVVAVRQAFGLVQRRLHEIGNAAGITMPTQMPVAQVAGSLRDMGHITARSEDAIRGLSIMHKLAARDDGSGLAVTVEQAREFVVLVQVLVYALSPVAPQSPRDAS